jgi:ribosome-associated toxin RatA of RatAB toxin-antitoxin module
MAQVQKSVLIEHPAPRMFHLVDLVEDYPKFLPWCGGTTLRERTDLLTHAAILIDYHGVKQSFATINHKDHPEWMHIELVEGPFAHLQGHWHFKPLGEAACKIEFRLEYQFASRMLEALVGPAFHLVANSFVDAFTKRADQIYGTPESSL